MQDMSNTSDGNGWLKWDRNDMCYVSERIFW